MIVKPIIPIWIMAIICVGLIALKRKRLAAFIRQIIMVVLLFMINLNICFTDGKTNITTKKTDAHVLFVIDTTLSMKAEDYDGNKERMEGVKAECEHIIDELPGAKFSVITFNNTAQIESPFSSNSIHTKNIIKSLAFPSEDCAAGTDLRDCVKIVENRLDSCLKSDNKKNIYLFYISDGELTAENAKLPSFEKISDYIKGGAVLGYGTEKGGKMYIESEENGREVLTYYDDEFEKHEAVSKIDETNLQKIASDMNVSYFHMEKGNEADTVISKILREAGDSVEEEDASNTKSTGVYFAIPLLLLMIYEFFSMHVRHNEKI